MARARYLPPPPEGWATVPQLAKRWGVSRTAVRDWISRGYLKARKFNGQRWKVSEEAAAAWEQKHPGLGPVAQGGAA